jgi:hypothetical protein
MPASKQSTACKADSSDKRDTSLSQPGDVMPGNELGDLRIDSSAVRRYRAKGQSKPAARIESVEDILGHCGSSGAFEA